MDQALNVICKTWNLKLPGSKGITDIPHVCNQFFNFFLKVVIIFKISAYVLDKLLIFLSGLITRHLNIFQGYYGNEKSGRHILKGTENEQKLEEVAKMSNLLIQKLRAETF